MKTQSRLLFFLLLCLPVFLVAQETESKAEEPTTAEPDLSPSSPEDTSTANGLLPSTETPAEVKAAEVKAVNDDTSSETGTLPNTPEVKTQLTQDIESATKEAADPNSLTTDVSPNNTDDASGGGTSGVSTVSVNGDGTDSAPASNVEPIETYAPDDAGLTVKEVQVENPSFEAELDPGGKPKMEETTQEIPALEMDFADSGEVTLEFPTNEQEAMEAEMGDDDSISVDFPDEEVRTIIRHVADLYDLNVVIPDTLVGSTSVKLRNVSWRQVFEVVLEPLGYTYVEDRNIIKIRSRDELLQEPVDTRVFLINYAVAQNLQASLAPLIDAAAGGRIQVDQRTNALIITERPSRMNDIQEIIERLDRPNAQVMIESKFIEVNDRNQENLGVNWTSLSGYRISAGPFQRQYESDTSRNNTNLTSSLSQRDFYARNTTVPDETGTEGVSDTFTTSLDNSLDILTTAATGRIDTAVFSAPAFEFVLSALETLSDSKLLTNPTLVTLDGEDAKLLIGDKYPIPSYTYNEERGTFEVSGFTYEDIGIVLTVRPQVNAAGFIRLDVNPQLSRQAGEVNFGGAGGATIPIINSTETESSVILKDGYTLAIGGLIQNDKQETVNKVPWLGDIPGLGYLFKSTGTEYTERNLIIFITAKTLNPDGTTYKDIIDQRMLFRMGITDHDIPGIKIPDAQKDAMDQIFEMRTEAKNDEMEADLFEKQMALKALQDAKAAKEAAEANDTTSPADKRNAVSRAR